MPDDREPAEAVGQERPGRLAQGTAHSQLHAAAMDLQDLTMGDILMLSTAMPPPAGPARQRDAMDIGPRSYTMEDDYRRYSPPASTSNPRGALSSSLISNALPPQKTVATHEQVASSVDGIPGPSSSSTSFSTPATSADRYPKTTHTSSTSNKLHSLLTSSRNTLPPPPTLNADPSFLPPPPLLPRIAAPTSSTATPHHTSTTTSSSVLPNTASHAASAHSPGPSSASFGTAPLLPSSLPSPLPQQQQLPINSNDGRYKRYTETQADYKPGGYARIKEGDRLNRGRYEVVKKLGVGHFSVVWLAWDREEGGYVAIKVVRSSRRYARAALHEDKLLTVIQGPRDERKDYIVSLLSSFEEPAWEGPEHHVCLVFELMGMSLTDVLRKNDFDGLPIKTVKLITKQALTGLSYLHSMGIAHTDIKPDNILLYHSPRQMSKMLRAQLEADEAEKERQAREQALNPKPEPVNWLEYKPKIPGLNPQQIKEIQLARIRSEQRKWTITPSFPLESAIPFANGKKIVKEFVLANKHLYKKYPIKPVPAISSSSSSNPSTRTSLENERTSASHPAPSEDSLKPAVEESRQVNSTLTTPTKDCPSTNPSNQSSASPKSKFTDTTNTTAPSSQTAPSSTQSSKSPYSSLGRLRPGSHIPVKDIIASMHAPARRPLNILRRQLQSEEAGLAQHLNTRNDAPFDLRHPRTISNGSSGGDETDFDKLLRQPLEYDLVTSGMGGPSPMFMQKSPSDSGGSEIFSPASTSLTRFFAGTASGGGSATDSPASLASTPINSSPELPKGKGLTRTGSIASTLASPSFTSFSPADSAGEHFYTSSSGLLAGRPGLSRAKSTYELDDEQAMLSLPASPPSHPTSFVSVTSMSPEVSMRKGSLLSGLARSGSDASIIGGTFDFSITEEVDPLLENGAEDGNVTLVDRQKVLPGHGTALHGLGLNLPAGLSQSKALAIPKASQHVNDSISPLVSSSPPTSMTSSIHSRASEVSSQSPPISMGSVETSHPLYQPKITKLESPARVKSDPLLNVHVKLSDLGNAIYYNELKRKGALPENVCTRQYRPPENIIQAEYNLGIDVWALGCVIYEMITGEMLFNPTLEKYRYTKEDDLLGQQIEILGPFSPEFALSGRKSLHFFNRHGSILRVRLTPWLLFDVMVKKYYMPRAKARKFCDFLLRMLEPDPSKRATVEELLQDPWINEIEEDDDMVLYRERRKRPATPTTDA